MDWPRLHPDAAHLDLVDFLLAGVHLGRVRGRVRLGPWRLREHWIASVPWVGRRLRRRDGRQQQGRMRARGCNTAARVGACHRDSRPTGTSRREGCLYSRRTGGCSRPTKLRHPRWLVLRGSRRGARRGGNTHRRSKNSTLGKIRSRTRWPMKRKYTALVSLVLTACAGAETGRRHEASASATVGCGRPEPRFVYGNEPHAPRPLVEACWRNWERVPCGVIRCWVGPNRCEPPSAFTRRFDVPACIDTIECRPGLHPIVLTMGQGPGPFLWNHHRDLLRGT